MGFYNSLASQRPWAPLQCEKALFSQGLPWVPAPWAGPRQWLTSAFLEPKSSKKMERNLAHGGHRRSAFLSQAPSNTQGPVSLPQPFQCSATSCGGFRIIHPCFTDVEGGEMTCPRSSAPRVERRLAPSFLTVQTMFFLWNKQSGQGPGPWFSTGVILLTGQRLAMSEAVLAVTLGHAPG